MTNPFYNPSGNPQTASEGLSALMRNEFISISAAFSLIPPFTASGSFVTHFTQVGNFTFTLPSANGSLATTANIATETTRATAAESVLTTAVSAEVSRATAAEGVNATAVTTEATARTAAITTEATARSTADALLAPKASPTFTGVPLAPTATTGTNTTQLATLAFVNASVAAATTGVSSVNTRTGAITIGSSDVTAALTFTPYNATNPNGYQTSAQLVTAVGTETTRATAAEALLAPLASPALTGTPTVPTAAPGTNTTQAASTAYSTAAITVETSRATTAEALLAPKASPTFTGTPVVPTAAPGTNTTQAASTAYVTAASTAATAAQFAVIHTVTGSRSFSTTYTNSNSKPMALTVMLLKPTSFMPGIVDLFIFIDGTQIYYNSSSGGNGVGSYGASGTVIVPSGSTYSVVTLVATPTTTWTETY